MSPRANPARCPQAPPAAARPAPATASYGHSSQVTPCPRPPVDRRGRPRHATRLQRGCRLIRARGEGPWFASVRNISAEGVGLVSSNFFKPRMLLTIEFPTGTASYGSPKLFCVKHVEQLPGTRYWRVGGVFAQRLSAEELRALGV
jgi:hypothetical protein